MMLFQFIVLQIIVFAGVIYFLKKILYGDTESAVNRLGRVYQDLLAKQAELNQKIEQAEKEYQQKKDEAQIVADKLKAAAMDDVRKKEDELIKRARAEAEEIINKARASRDQQTREIKVEVERQTIDYAASLLAGIFTPGMLLALHGEMLTLFYERADAIDLGGIDPTIKEVLVKTAQPLKKEELERLEQFIKTKIQRSLKIEQTVDEKIMAGLVLQFGTLVLDGCLLNSIKDASDQTKERLSSHA